ncbi:MAG: hypothetical protein QXH03_02795 [Candidatus Bathyarchaeia archaeon]
MTKRTLIALTAGIGVSAALAYFLYRKTLIRYLYISAGEGGTTDPPPGKYAKFLNEEVTITAVPDAGYTYGTWIVDGVDLGHHPSITITMDTHHTVICTFWKGGTPPPTYPVKIVSLGPIQILSNIGAVAFENCIHISHYGNNWEANQLTQVPIKFQVLDAEGRGVPDVDVALWTDPMPDPSRYKGKLLLNGGIRTYQQPLIRKTGAEGIVTANVAYLYGLNDGFKQICSDANVHFHFACLIPICAGDRVAEDGYCLPWGCWICWTEGECATMQPGCEKMGSWQVNRIYARVVGTTYETAELAYCGFHVKWIPVEVVEK